MENELTKLSSSCDFEINLCHSAGFSFKIRLVTSTLNL